MSKVICEICGTAYPDTENECPVCGYEKPETAEFAPEEPASAESVRAAYVKGGRFSKSNVKKSNRGKPVARKSASGKKRRNSKRKSNDTGLIIAIIVLLLAIIGTAAYIYFNYFAPVKTPDPTDPPVVTTTEPTTVPSTTTAPTTEPEEIPCESLTLYEKSVILNKEGSQWLLNVVPSPANTTDEITYASSDQNIAIVSADGKITAVANGEATITITCGTVTVECKVLCQLAEPTEATTEPTTAPTTEPEEDMSTFTFKKTDITFYRQGETFKLYDGDIDISKITWTVGKSSVCTITNGVVKAVGPGMTNVYAEYNGVKLHCIVRCDF